MNLDSFVMYKIRKRNLFKKQQQNGPLCKFIMHVFACARVYV